MKRKIAAITTSRSDYAHLRWLLHDLARHPQVDLSVIALGPHLSPEFGHTAKQIAQDQKAITSIECLLSSDTDVGMAKSLGLATLGLADAMGRIRPDIMLLIADRYEMLAPAAVALTLRIPIAHIEGGETTAGAIDDAVRNAITKMSHLHFACTKAAKQRVIAMGEQPWRVTYSGSVSIDNLRRSKLLSRTQLEKKLGISLDQQTVLALYHPVTLMKDTVQEATELSAALEKTKEQIFFVYPNADAGSRELIHMTEEFVTRRHNSKLFINLDHTTYLSLLKNVDLLIGNSSSGVIESTSIGIPALNIGIRQRGREHAGNVLDVPATREAISKAIRTALSADFKQTSKRLKNPYGDGHACRIITKVLTATPLENLLFKS
ncbi:MAG: UDP-N-acetylglucosamine 2-epimerase [Acidobacteriaceae bacterium]|jgi:UDP-hydrolysing UDP-N-acetyl-D-glucosamine 2-epimerase|nr:UDP-N-acetylglucosamine 2-epimerase [Acidobacteriaceae bacterium]